MLDQNHDMVWNNSVWTAPPMCEPGHNITIVPLILGVLPYLQKITPHSHHKTIHTHMIIHTKILTLRTVTHTRKYYSCNKLSTYPQLPQLNHNTLENVAPEPCHGMEQLRMGRPAHVHTGAQYNYCATNNWCTSIIWLQT